MNKEIRNGLNGAAASGKQLPASPLLELCACPPEETLKQLESSPSGLTAEQVEERRQRYGPNEISHEKPPTWYQQLFPAFLTPCTTKPRRS